MIPTPDHEFLTLTETANVWRCSTRTVRRVAKRAGWDEMYKIGREYRLPRELVLHYWQSVIPDTCGHERTPSDN